ncbi:HlyD family efflux transporter periplasmic adaptor subunit [Pedobacter cryoconitis]|uniref:HlyD family secretion protein n=1 Tax=Pedobacter cryoconitis TaxID=188932 RepID=A0A7X0J7Y1_9SPHI|nr:HlyD family efflux transporter periplasmic adaptor subunit [Pedobacter cryoconitis]MBB6502470.1 hypothetical protein [Pedobacter cryoconitis]
MLAETKTNNLLNKINSYSMTLTFATLCLLILITFIIPYRDSLSFKAEFHTQHKIIPVISPYNGIIKKNVFNINNAIEPNLFLFTIFDLSAQKDISIYAKEAGYYMPNKIQFRNKTYVSKNDTLFYIMPDIKSKGEVYCTAAADESNVAKLNVGNKVMISVDRDEQEFSISGTISSISRVPDRSGKYPFQISLENKDVRFISEKDMFYFNHQGKALINYKTKNLAHKLLSFL